uniref:Uncharacterized protein n=1 Tax=Anopheles atroparvus TaxID=41427 RepID=A0AAG5D4B1_ANOAO
MLAESSFSHIVSANVTICCPQISNTRAVIKKNGMIFIPSACFND